MKKVGVAHNILCTGKEHYNLSKTIWLGHCNVKRGERKRGEKRELNEKTSHS